MKKYEFTGKYEGTAEEVQRKKEGQAWTISKKSETSLGRQNRILIMQMMIILMLQ